jgi:hypothetical protein
MNHVCLLESVTLDFTGNCENIMHCDEYECETCQHFQICTKDKKKAFGEKQKKPRHGTIQIPSAVQIEYCDNGHCIYCKNSKCRYSGGITLNTNGTCQMAEYRDNGTARGDERG